MKKRIIAAGIIFIAFSLLLSSALTLALAQSTVKMQGLVMSIDAKNNVMVVNEKTFVWDQSTVFNDEKGAQIGIDKFKPRSWVFIEGEKGDQSIVIKTIYLLPKYVGSKERYLYPFMQ